MVADTGADSGRIVGSMVVPRATVGMSGQRLQTDILRLVWKQTHFGRLWQLRSIFLILAVIAPFFSRWISLMASGLLLGSLAWQGMGVPSSGPPHLQPTPCIYWPPAVGLSD